MASADGSTAGAGRPRPGRPLGTTFTYQARLASGDQAASGLFDFCFSLFDSASGGGLLGGPLTNPAVSVAGGLFTTTLDFGAGAFTGDARWLEIAVRTNGSGAYHTLAPRQPLTPAPYALWTPRAGSVADGAITSAALADHAVTGVKIADGAILPSALGQNGATNGQVLQWCAASNAWVAAQMAAGATQLLGYKENGPFAVPPLASGNNAVALGEHGQALGNNSVVGGGLDNLASSWFTTVGGGWSNTAAGLLFGRTTIAGGEMNLAAGDWATVGGGQLNTAGGPLYGRATVAGGWQNSALGDMSAIGGGSQNLAVAGHGVIGGGQSNAITTLQAPWSAIGGGHLNQISGMAATVGGGFQNTASGGGGVVGGGESNTAGGLDATVGGGHTNTASASFATVAGGELNAASNNHSTVGGGNQNKAKGDASTVGGGNVNGAYGDFGTVAGGQQNSAEGTAATGPGGSNNRAVGNYSLAAGQSALAFHQGSMVFADSQPGVFASEIVDEFSVRAFNGVRLETDVGVHLDAANRPLIVRDYDPFANGVPNGKAGIGRWGLFMEPYTLVLGIPNTDVGARYMEVARYNPDGTREKIFGVGNDGVTAVKVLTITGGSDLAEPFEVSDPDQAPKGAVMVIDDQHPGRLRLSTQPYDKRVAGVVSGAGGLNPGLTLSQQGLTDKGLPVALSGRVFTLADASLGPIRPGDQLTTSATPGHAMKVTDYAKAQGAILGKAMTGLEHGQGVVLVLVSLQ